MPPPGVTPGSWHTELGTEAQLVSVENYAPIEVGAGARGFVLLDAVRTGLALPIAHPASTR